MKEYEIFKRNKWGAAPTGVVIQATTKSGAVYEARKKLGAGSWQAIESSAEQRAANAKTAAEVAELIAQSTPLRTVVVARGALYDENECQNCGMIDVPLRDGHCEGCICLNCKRGALDCGSSMNAAGWCDECEQNLKKEKRR